MNNQWNERETYILKTPPPGRVRGQLLVTLAIIEHTTGFLQMTQFCGFFKWHFFRSDRMDALGRGSWAGTVLKCHLPLQRKPGCTASGSKCAYKDEDKVLLGLCWEGPAAGGDSAASGCAPGHCASSVRISVPLAFNLRKRIPVPLNHVFSLKGS